jgi:hypothetical protein
MNEELEPVGHEESVLRRIPMSFYEEGLPTPIQRAAFRPNEQDTTGLSVYRARFVSSYSDVLRNVKPEKREKYYICRLCARDLFALNLTVVPDPDPEDIPGHCIIPELSWQKYQDEYERLAEIQLQLAGLGSRDIVHRPRT